MTDASTPRRLPTMVTGAVLGLSFASIAALITGITGITGVAGAGGLVSLFTATQGLETATTWHTLMEWSAVVLSLATAFLGFVCYRACRDPLVLTIAFAGVMSGLWDALHTLESAALIATSAGSELAIPLSWAASRTFRGAIILGGALGLLAGASRRIAAASLGGTFLASAGVAVLLHVVPQFFSGSMRPESVVSRPWDLPALVLFALGGFVVLPLVHRREPALLSRVLILSTVPEVVTQIEMAFFSRNLYDEAYVLAHLTKLVALAIPSMGILLELSDAYQQEESRRGHMETIVDDLRMREEELRTKEAHLEQLTEGIREVFWISEPDGSRMYYVSPLYEEMFGLDVESLYENPDSFLEVVHSDDREVMQSLIERNLEDEFEVDYRILRRDGTTRWLRTRGFPVRDEGGRVYRLAGITEDVTEHKLAEEAVRVSEARMRALFSALPDLVLRTNDKGLVLDFHGHIPGNPEQVVGRHLVEVLPAPSARLALALKKTLASGRLDVQVLDYRAEVSGRRGDFEARFVKSAVNEVLVLVRDLTDQKMLEREILEVSRREQERIGSDLHDGIAQSLTGIALLSRVLHRELEVEGRPEAEKAGRIAHLVEETLAQTRTLARGLAPVEIDEGGFTAALEEMASGVEAVHDVRCLCRCDETALVRDHEKATHLFRIAQEAVNNALRHGAPTAIEISLQRKNGRFVMSIKDDGIGFERSRLDSAGGARASGAGSGGGGMGLSIMRYRARMIDASIELASAESKGTVVTCQWSATD